MPHPNLTGTIDTATSKPTFATIGAALCTLKQSIMANAMSHYYIDEHTYVFMVTLMSNAGRLDRVSLVLPPCQATQARTDRPCGSQTGSLHQRTIP